MKTFLVRDTCVRRVVPPCHDVTVQSLLYRFAQWHALAKLRLHSQSTLSLFENTFKILSKQLRAFRDLTCTAFATVELPKEKVARQRRFAQHVGSHNSPSEPAGPKVKKFNLSTYKFHAMGDYMRTIRLFGTTDSYTTQIVSILSPLSRALMKSCYALGGVGA